MKNMMFTATLFSLFFGMAAFADESLLAEHNTEAERAGLDIKIRSDNQERGRTLTRTLTMILTDKRGTERKRVMKGVKKYFGKDIRTLNTFSYPKNIDGTALLTHDYHTKDDDQWIFIPSARNLRRIPSSRKSEYFMGTDFTFEDMKEDLQLTNYHYTLLRTEEIDGKKYYVITSVPRTPKLIKEIGYSKIVQWLEEDSLLPRRGVYYDKKGVELKRFESKVIKIQGIYTYAYILMTNSKRKHQTLYTFDEIVFNQEYPDAMFTPSSVKAAIN